MNPSLREGRDAESTHGPAHNWRSDGVRLDPRGCRGSQHHARAGISRSAPKGALLSDTGLGDQLIPADLLCLVQCANGSVVDPSGVYTLLAGDLFGFFGSTRVGNITASNVEVTLRFVVQPFRASGSRNVPFKMSGHARLFGNDVGSILAESDITGRGTARVGLGQNFDDTFTLTSLDLRLATLPRRPSRRRSF